MFAIINLSIKTQLQLIKLISL